MPRTNARDSRQTGFSLIEVIVALALLAAVLLTVSGLFIQGSQSVNTGRDLTEATSLATNVLEQMDRWAYTQLYTNFCKASTDAAFSFVTSPTPTCATFNAIPNAGSGTSTWQSNISQRLPNAKATVAVTPMGAATFGAAKGIRVAVTVDWTLTGKFLPTGAQKTRSVSLETVRF